MRKKSTEPASDLITEIEETTHNKLHNLLKTTTTEFFTLKNDLVKPLGITLAQYAITYALARGVNTGAQLARFNMITPQSVNTLLNTLESKKLITRRTSPDHMQVNLIELTAQGRKISQQAEVKIEALDRAMENLLTPEENHNFRIALTKIATGLKNIDIEKL